MHRFRDETGAGGHYRPLIGVVRGGVLTCSIRVAIRIEADGNGNSGCRTCSRTAGGDSKRRPGIVGDGMGRLGPDALTVREIAANGCSLAVHLGRTRSAAEPDGAVALGS